MEAHLRVVVPMNGKFVFHKRPDGTIDKGKVVCLECKKEFAYHRSSSSLAYHLNAKHPAASAATASSEDVSNIASQSKAFRQTKLENTPRMSKSATDKLTNVIAKWIAMNCRPINIVEDITDDDPAYVVKFKNAFQKDLAARRANGNEIWFEVATALDPRFKDLKCLPREKREQVWTILENMLQAAEPRRADSLQPSTEDDGPAQKKRRSELLLGSDSDSEDGIESGELQRYRAEPSISIDDCPLQWWYAHSGVYEKLSVLAQKYLASPATSVPCERLFSLAGHIVQKKRAALLPENVTRLVCLSDWLRKKK
ncbi:uncharacterized protein LOC109195437 [Oreochromis niloticus]|uniref:uncharacterized protein LOC109195437 n=1 Tax=Oreochromis niloticus TaxID=8128 RepID=UPI00090479FB|nr:uncharacterized protein LOC109195437 [Oreochromis niloticus]